MEMIVQKVSANQTPVTVTELVESAIKNTFKQVIRCKFLHLASQPRFQAQKNPQKLFCINTMPGGGGVV